MRRRDISTLLLASAAGAAAVSTPAQAQSCTSPCYPQTAAESGVGATVTNPSYPPGDVRRYGAVGDGSANDTTALQNALNAANAGGYTMYLPAGSFRITSQLQKLQSFKCPNIRGEGHRYSRIAYSALSGVAALYIQGGSGQLCGAVIQGIGFDGSSGSYAIEVDGQDGVTIRDCDFGQNAAGLRLHNRTSGAFTEYTIAENCVFEITCTTALQYLVTSGTNSFNGSGLVNCKIAVDQNSDQPIYIGAGAQPYNAPLSFQVWVSGSGKTVIYNASSSPAFFHGTITVEPGTVSSQSQSPTLGRGAPVYLVGGVESWGYVNYGSLQTGYRAAGLGPESGAANGQRLIRQHPWTIRKTLSAGATTIFNAAADSNRLVYVEIEGPNYDYRYILTVAHQGFGGAGFVQTIATVNAFNSAGYGPPTFSVDANGNFSITNGSYPSSGVVASVDVLPFGLNRMAYLASAAEYGNV